MKKAYCIRLVKCATKCKQSANRQAKQNTIKAIEEANSVPYATEMTVLDLDFCKSLES